jgi:hypothetical protein
MNLPQPPPGSDQVMITKIGFGDRRRLGIRLGTPDVIVCTGAGKGPTIPQLEHAGAAH